RAGGSDADPACRATLNNQGKDTNDDQVHSLLITTHDEIRVKYRHLTGMNLVKTLASTRPGTTMIPSQTHIAKQSLKRLAQRYVVLDEQVQLLDAQLHELVQ